MLKTFPTNLIISEQVQNEIADCKGEFVVYLAHFCNPIKKKNGFASHYIGLTKNLVQRFTAHANGTGNGLVFKAFQQGKVILVQVWKQDGNFERKLKNRKSAKSFCSICKSANSK